jgi:hypothetical protein
MSDVNKCFISSHSNSSNIAHILGHKSEYESNELEKKPDILVQLLNKYTKNQSSI